MLNEKEKAAAAKFKETIAAAGHELTMASIYIDSGALRYGSKKLKEAARLYILAARMRDRFLGVTGK